MGSISSLLFLLGSLQAVITGLLIWIGLLAMLVTFVSVLWPLQFIGLPTRKRSAKALGVSLVLVLISGVVYSDSVVFSLHFSPRGEAKCVRGPSGRGASRLARAGVLDQYVEHGKQAQRSPGGRIVCFDRRVVRNAG